jgi:adenylosuccinate lyase
LKDSPLSPIDDRYYEEVRELSPFFSERSLVDERARVELEYLSFLMKVGVAPRSEVPSIEVSYEEVKRLEADLGHDVKALEKHLGNQLRASGREELAPFVHLGLTSEDVNNLAYARLLSRALKSVMIPAYERLAVGLSAIAGREAKTAMLARTHGRPAIPTTFGKELANFALRLAERVAYLKRLKPWGKVSGAVGTYASFKLLRPSRRWPELLKGFVESMGLKFVKYTTQVIPNEGHSDIFHCLMNINTIMLGLARDLWGYQALDDVHFKRKGMVSSSTMPQKENPVDLENAEGQLEISNSIMTLLAYRLGVTRWQRDLSDSPIKRMMGQALAHSLIACKRITGSLASMSVDRKRMAEDLSHHREVLAEAVQLLLRMDGNERGYDDVRKALENGKFSVPEKYVARISEYLGFASDLARDCEKEVARLLASPGASKRARP